MCIALGLGRAYPASGQSITAGRLDGVVRDTVGAPLSEAFVSATDVETGVAWVFTTARDGRYQFRLLPAAAYHLRAEALGHRPKLVRDVVIYPGDDVNLDVALVPTPPPVGTVDTVVYRGSAIRGGGAGVTRWFTDLELTMLPQNERAATSLSRYATSSADHLSAEGLPGALSGIAADGVSFVPARHPALGAGAMDAIAFPLSTLERAELFGAAADVEWTGLSGEALSGFTRRGTRDLRVQTFVDWADNSWATSKYFDPASAGESTVRAGALVSGPLVPDTAGFVLGVEARRVDTPFPAAWVADSVQAPVDSIARDSFSVPLGAYLKPRLVHSDIVSGFGRVDWRVAPGHALTVRANVGKLSARDPDLGPDAAASLGSTLKGTDVSVAGALSSILSASLSQELRIGFDASTRDYGDAGPPATTIVDGGWTFGSDPTLPGHFRATTFRVSDALHWQFPSHSLKIGGDVTVPSFEMTYTDARDGWFAFGGPSEFASRMGLFVQSVGTLSMASFSLPRFGGFLEDRWTAAPGLDVLGGVRLDVAPFPGGQVAPNDTLRLRTGLDNTTVPTTRPRLSPRLAADWDLGNRHLWLVQAVAAIERGSVDPAAFAEVVTHAGALEVRRGLGDLGSWPGAPDSTRAPVLGPTVTLLGPSFEAPRSGRVSLGVSHSLGSTTSFAITGTYRHTDFLPRRHDLNRLPAPVGFDQYGRPLYGTLRQIGSLLAAVPGSNRRFDAFDQIDALDPDGFSNYWGVTLTLERRFSTALQFLASYTYSRTTDNWFGGRGGVAAARLSPFPDSLNGQDWADGRSDFDVPHRVVLAASWHVPGRFGPILAAVYRYRSGDPFTPGFRVGVDANGDGAAGNDPAFVDASVAGVAPVFARWSCLGAQVGRFAARNSCREPAIQSLDLRLAIPVTRVGTGRSQLVVDALNVVESDVGVRDYALYLVDRTRTLSVNPTTGRVTVPLVANSSFGNILTRRTTGRSIRLGLNVEF